MMAFSTEQDSALENLCRAAIERRLSDLYGLPEELVKHVAKIYRRFIAGYLNILRQKENKAVDWTPETLSIDSELVDGMRHFFSDYQHITREYKILNQQIDRLREIDKDRQPLLFQRAIEEILYESVPGIQWALLSGRRAAEAVVKEFAGST
jgi:hypothetical protein